ncbi:MAG TPA: hypothetical protein VF796_26615, partial [Humisphaera sp.]
HGEVLRIHLDVWGGRAVTSFGSAPSYSRRPFDVDASGLRADASRVWGDLVVSRLAGDGKPAGDGRRVEVGRYTVDVRSGSGGALRGAFVGTTVDSALAGGDAWADAAPRPAPAGQAGPHKVFVKLEDGLAGGADWQNRVFFDFVATDGRAAAGRANNNKGIYTAEFRGADLRWDGQAFAGTLDCAVVESGIVTRGAYHVRLDGHMVGPDCYGRFATTLGDSPVKSGYFVGRVEPSAAQPSAAAEPAARP